MSIQSRGVKDLKETLRESRTDDAGGGGSISTAPSMSAYGRANDTDLRAKLNKLLQLSHRDKEQIASLTAKLLEARRELENGGGGGGAAKLEMESAMNEANAARDECARAVEHATNLEYDLNRIQERCEQLARDLAASRSNEALSADSLDSAVSRAVRAERALEEAVAEQSRSDSARSRTQLDQAAAWASDRQRLEEALTARTASEAATRAELDTLTDRLQTEHEHFTTQLAARDAEAQAMTEAHALTQAALTSSQEEVLQLKQSLRRLMIDHADATAEAEAAAAAAAASQARIEINATTAEREQLAAEAQKLRERLAALETAHTSKLSTADSERTIRETELVATIDVLRADLQRALSESSTSDAARLRADSVAVEALASSQRAEASLVEALEAAKQSDSLRREAERASQAAKDALDLARRQTDEWRTRCADETLARDEERTQARVRAEEIEREQRIEREALVSDHAAAQGLLRSELEHTQSLLTASESRISRLTSDAKEHDAVARKLRVSEKLVASLQAEVGTQFIQLQGLRRELDSFRLLRAELALSVDKLLHFEATLAPSLTCTACTNLFVDPVSLPCGHTLCRACCRNRRQSQQEQFTCTDCVDARADRKTVTFALNQIVPAANLDIVLGKFVFLRQVLATIKTEVERNQTEPITAAGKMTHAPDTNGGR